MDLNKFTERAKGKAEMNMLNLDILHSAFEEGEKPWT